MKIRYIFPLLAVMLLAFSMKANDGVVKEISQAEFKKLVSNYQGGIAKWNFVGTRPVVVDFYADWCGPCRKLSPVIAELAKTYKGKIDFYKVNVDNNMELAQQYNVTSIPLLLLAPVKGKPQFITGVYPKDELVKAFNYVFWRTAK